MVLKKKKKKGSKKKKTKSKSKSVGPDVDDGVDRVENGDPSTLISGTTQTGADTGSGKSGKKKKVKKKKMTKEERAQEKLEKNMDKIRKEPEIFTNFVDRMDRWLRHVAPRAKQMFKKIDREGEGIITYELFKSGMFDLNVPLNKIELHLLATLLDIDNSGDIDYSMLGDGLQHVRDGDEEGDEDEDGEEEGVGGEEKEGVEEETEPPKLLKLIPTDRKLNTCVCCKMAIDQPYKEKNPRYVQMELRLVTFDKFKAHPGHVSILVHSHLHVFGLIQLLVQLTYVQSTKITIFRDRTRSKDARLHPNLTLEDCGYPGGIKDRPQEIVLFYDYTVEFTDCPVLICDHYFGQSIKA